MSEAPAIAIDITDRSSCDTEASECLSRKRSHCWRVGEYVGFAVIGIATTILACLYRYRMIHHAVEVVLETRMDDFLQREARHMDVVLLLDGSDGISQKEWESQVELSKGLILTLDKLLMKEGLRLRASLGQISNPDAIDVHLHRDPSERFRDLQTWQCPEATDSACNNDAARTDCLADPHCIVRRRGVRDIARALCGKAFVADNEAGCTQGAMGEFLQDVSPENIQYEARLVNEASPKLSSGAPPRTLLRSSRWRLGWWWPKFRSLPVRTVRATSGIGGATRMRLPTTSMIPTTPPSSPRESPLSGLSHQSESQNELSGLSHQMRVRVKTILMVSGGQSIVADQTNREAMHLAKDAAAAARLVKSASWRSSSSPLIFNVLVGSRQRQDTSFLQALSSCCLWNNTEQVGERCVCAETVSPNCPFYDFKSSFEALLQSAATVAKNLKQWSTAYSVDKGEVQQRINTVIQHANPTKQLSWFLLPALPYVFLVIRAVLVQTMRLCRMRAAPSEDTQEMPSSAEEQHYQSKRQIECDVQQQDAAEENVVPSLAEEVASQMLAKPLANPEVSRPRAATEAALPSKGSASLDASLGSASSGYTGRRYTVAQPTYLWGGKVLPTAPPSHGPQATILSFANSDAHDDASQISQESFDRKSWIYLDGRLSSYGGFRSGASLKEVLEIDRVRSARWFPHVLILSVVALVPAASCLSGMFDFVFYEPESVLSELLS